jgi:hypothetical protein
MCEWPFGSNTGARFVGWGLCATSRWAAASSLLGGAVQVSALDLQNLGGHGGEPGGLSGLQLLIQPMEQGVLENGIDAPAFLVVF